MAPTIIILGVFVVLPILIALVLAFHKVQLLGVPWQKIFEVRKPLRSKIVYATTGKMSAINFTSATISV